MARVLIIETGDDWRAMAVPDGWDSDGMAYGRAAVVEVEPMADPAGAWQDDGESPDTFLPSRPGEPYGGGV